MKGFELMQVMAHELAHQFFGNLVTSDWWSDIWLNEAFAGFFEFAIAEQVRLIQQVNRLGSLVFKIKLS